MSGDTLAYTTPSGRHISAFVSDYELIAGNAAQLQQTGEETLELHKFVTSIIAGDIEAQEGISVEALRQMALTVGDSLWPLGDYFCTLAEATWNYADACRVAGDATKQMKARQDNLTASLATIVEERMNAASAKLATEGLDEEQTASGQLTRYSVLNTEGELNVTPNIVSLEGKKRDDALRFIETSLESLETLQESIHSRQDTQLADFDSAYEDWEAAAQVFADALDGILGVLEDTDAENAFQRSGSIADFLGGTAAVADIAAAIPLTMPFGVAIGLAASLLEAGYQIHQHNTLVADDGESIRVAEGQIEGELGEAGKALLGVIPFGDFVRRYGTRTEGVEHIDDPEPGDEVRSVKVELVEGRETLTSDLDVDISPIRDWAEEAEETNPEYTYAPSNPVGGVPEPQPVQIPEAGGYQPPGDDEPVQIPSAPGPEPEIEIEAPGSDAPAIEVEVDPHG